MTSRVLIIGGYGNFGSLISRRLVQEENIHLIIAGRSAEKAKELATELGMEWTVLDINMPIDKELERLNPDIVIHTSGPFQGQGYEVAKACIRHKCHYIDLADGREFVKNIQNLDGAAKEAGVLVVSGASSVPCLTSAIIDHHKADFQKLEELDYAITTAQRTNPGIATTAAILGYAGKPFVTVIDGRKQNIFGWQDMSAHKYPELGWRLLGNCDVPDLELFPERYPDLKTIRFRAGLEVPLLHIGLWSLSWLTRWGVISNLRPMAGLFSKIAKIFDVFGSNRSGFHMTMKGIGADGKTKIVTVCILTNSGHGPNIPCIPSEILAMELSRGTMNKTGAMACVDLIPLSAYLDALRAYDISWTIE
ncbi:MAG: saccharopine dehydrogenase NADP-binding domain-containing protein [Alphaproteobacteria bacterium]|nr:saccharopine dehydrogenase NADP-binding domain-containing protein [Alphaproteobacteria bacterium]